jgi:ABC-2 type transport system permease protein
LRTLFVTQPDSPIATQEIQKYGETLSSQLTYAGTTGNQAEALDQLQRGQVDLVIVEPAAITSTLQNNQQAVLTLYHHEIDPVQVSYITYLGWLFAGQVNQQVLRSFVAQGQTDAVDVQTSLQAAHQNVAALRLAVQSGDEAQAKQKQQGLSGNVDAVSTAVGASLLLLDSVQKQQGAAAGSTDPVKSMLADLRQNTNQLNDSSGTSDERLARLDKIDKDLTDLDGQLAQFQSIDPSIIVSPFRSETKASQASSRLFRISSRRRYWRSCSSIWPLRSPPYPLCVSAT